MHTRHLLFLSILVTAFARADVPDVTSSLEYVSNPAMHRWPAGGSSCGALDLQFHRGTLLVGSGEVENNQGPVWVYGTDPLTLEESFEYSAGTEALASCRVASWGELLVPSQDLHDGDPNGGTVFTRDATGAWKRFNSIGGSVPTASSGVVYNKTHIWDMEEFDGRVFTSGYQLHWSTNRCVKFVDTGSITNAYRVLYYMTSASGGTGRWSLRRQMQLLRFANDLYAVPNTLIQPNNRVADTDKWYNKAEVFHWNPSTLKFDESRQAMSTLFPNISSNDFRLVLSSKGVTDTWDPLPTGTYDTVLVRLWHTTPFKGRVLYVGCYDTLPKKPALTSYPLPLMGCSATLQTSGWGANTTKTIKATRLSFDGDTEEYPWDFTVVGDTCYALTSKPNASTKVVRHSVWKSTNGTSFTRVFSFDFHQNMISLDYRDGWFWFGVGVKNATRGYAYDKQADEAGAIYRVRLPQEPTSVEAVNPPTAVAEGGSASIAFRLTAQPSSNLTLRVAARERRGVSLDKSSLTFTTSNWSTPQTVSVALADDDVGDMSKIFVQCGAFGDDVERGEFFSPQVTSALVTLEPVENDIPATVVSESCDPGVGKCTYRATFDSLGSVNGTAASSASVSVKVYSDSALTALAGETSGTVSVTGTERSFSVNGLERGVWYWLVAETSTAPGVSHVFTAKYLSPIAAPENLVDLMDDESNREATYSNSTSGGATGSTAFDNKTTNFGGYKKPVEFFYLFKTPAVVKAFGVEGAGNSNPDQDPSTIKLFGGSSTNASDLALLFSRTGEPSWTAGEWRRWLVENETAYACYKVQVSGAHQHCYIREIELYGSADDKGRIVPTDPATFGSLSYDTATVGDSTVRIYHDLAYGTRGDAEGEGAEYTAHSWGYHNHRSGNYFDVYADDVILSSASARAKMPVFVFLHGGSWSQSYDKDGSSRDLLKRVAAAGYFVVTMDYQLQSDITEQGETTMRENATFADMLADVDTMMTYLKTALPAIGLPTDKIVIGGESAGAHLAMCYAWDQSGTGLSGVSLRHDLNVACVMSAVGPANLADEAMLGPILAALSISDPAVQTYAQGFLTLMGWLTGEDVPGMLANNDMAGAAAALAAWSPLGLVNGESCHAILAYGCTNASASAAMASDGVVPVSNFNSLTNALTAATVSHDAQLFMLPAGMNHGNVSWNYEPSVSWIVEKLTAFKSANFDDPPPVVPTGRTDFAKYRQLTLARDLHVTSAVANVPALVRLSEGNGFSYSDFTLQDGGDLMFADEEGNPLPHEVDTWNTSGESLVWVRLPSSAAGTKIDMFWGRGGRPRLPASGVWSGYKGVWHMNSSSPHDASESGNDGSARGAAGTDVGKVGNALSLPNTNSFVSCGTALPNPDMAHGFTVSGWANLANTTGNHALFGKAWFMSVRFMGKNIQVTTPRIKDHTAFSTSVSAGSWFHWALTFVPGSNGHKFYINGEIKNTQTASSVSNATVATEMWLGHNQWGDQGFVGQLDEMRLRTDVLSADQIAAEYYGMNTEPTDIFTFGDAVAIPAAGQLPTFRSAANGGAMAFFGSGADRRLTFYLEGTLATAYYAVFTNGTLQGPFFAAADGVTGANSGILVLPVDAKEPSKFFAIGVSDEPIHEGDPLTL